jgi:hypothetical protein
MDSVSFVWFLNGTLVSVSNTYEYRAATYSADWYFINCTVSDGELNTSRTWVIHIKKTNIPPTAIIDFIKPNPATLNEGILFVGYGIDTDGKIARYSWRYESGQFGSSPVINISSLPPGKHIILFKVQDDDGAWSEEDGRYLLIENPGIEDGDANRKGAFLSSTDYAIAIIATGFCIVLYRVIKNSKLKR